MIAQSVKTEISSVIAKFGGGDIAIGMKSMEDSPEVLITFSNIPKEDIGKDVTGCKCNNTPIILAFDSVESVKVLKEIVNKTIKELKQKEEEAAKKALQKFTVGVGKIFVTNCFRTTNPNAEKIMKCQKYFMENGKLDEPIEVSESLTLTDGYVRYLVATYNGLEKVDVVAPKGINIKVGNELINFVSNEIVVSYNMVDGRFCLIIENGGKRYNIPAVDNVEARNMIRKIINVFDAKIMIPAVSTLNVGLMEKLKDVGIDYTRIQ